MNGTWNKRVLVAGIGNLFMGDDAFGVEVVRELARRPLADSVQVVDFGIRSYDLAYALADPYEQIILVDALARGGAAGTVFLLELDPNEWRQSGPGSMDAHRLDVVQALRLALGLGARPKRLYLVGCEPESLGGEDGSWGLSQSVQRAVPQAVERIESLLDELYGEPPREERAVAKALRPVFNRVRRAKRGGTPREPAGEDACATRATANRQNEEQTI